MGEETTWFDALPGTHNLTLFAKQYLERKTLLEMLPSSFSLTHVFALLLVLAFVTVGAMTFSSAMSRGGQERIVPPGKFNLRNLFEMFSDSVLGVAEGVLGAQNARRFLPLIGTLAFFIFFSNVMALIPGFVPPTSNMKTNLALALTVFGVTHVVGFKENGIAYLKHFLGPVLWLAPLMVIIEIVSHIARPLSLTLRLLGNIFADHKVVGVFFSIVPLIVPVPFLILGVLVAIIQTLVFCLLSMVYIQGSLAHDHGHDDHGHRHEHHESNMEDVATLI